MARKLYYITIGALNVLLLVYLYSQSICLDVKNEMKNYSTITNDGFLQLSNNEADKHNVSYKMKSISPYHKFVFLKVHKAGSSTAQNIFLRYGETRNLTFLLSRIRKFYYDNVISLYSSLNDNNTLPPPENKTYDILCCHVLYNKEHFETYFPGKTAYIGIVREPFQQFLSTVNYFGPLNLSEQDFKNTILKFLENPSDFDNGLSPTYSVYKNRMAVEFDFPKHLFKNYSKVESNNYLEKLDSEFHCVIVLEYFMESVVLMRRILGWNIKDILYLNKNLRNYHTFDETYINSYKKYAKLDYDLYDFFYKRLWQRILKEGIDFHMELLYFSRLRNEVNDFCTLHYTTDIYFVNESKWSPAFNISQSDCKLLLMEEHHLVERIRKRQYGEISTND